MKFSATPCEYCGAEVIWATTREGRRMTVDAHPDRLGLISLEGLDPIVRVIGQDYREPRYRPHFKTCPAALHWGAWTTKGRAGR